MNRVNIFFHYAALQTWHFFFHLWAKKPSYAKGKKKQSKRGEKQCILSLCHWLQIKLVLENVPVVLN